MEFQRHRRRVLRVGEGWETESMKEIYRSFRNENVGTEEWPGNLGYLVVTELWRMRLVQRTSRKTLPFRLCSWIGKSEWLARNTEECLKSGDFLRTVTEAGNLRAGASYFSSCCNTDPKKLGGFHSNSVSVCQPHPSLMLFQNHSQKHSEPANSYITLTILFICHYPSNPLKLYPLAKDLGLIFKTKKLKSKISPRPTCKQFLRVGSLS